MAAKALQEMHFAVRTCIWDQDGLTDETLHIYELSSAMRVSSYLRKLSWVLCECFSCSHKSCIGVMRFKILRCLQELHTMCYIMSCSWNMRERSIQARHSNSGN